MSCLTGFDRLTSMMRGGWDKTSQSFGTQVEECQTDPFNTLR